MVEVECFTGTAIAPYLDALAGLRIAVFREYPYLYNGTLEYERRYLAAYAESEHHLVVIAREGNRVVGASTAMPLAKQAEAALPMVLAGYDPTTVCYFGESVLEPAYRGQGIGHAFFDHRECHAQACGFRFAAFCAVERSAGHPRCPADYVPHDAFWRRRGYTRRADVVASFAWRDLDDALETSKSMVFWIKELR